MIKFPGQETESASLEVEIADELVAIRTVHPEYGDDYLFIYLTPDQASALGAVLKELAEVAAENPPAFPEKKYKFKTNA